MTLAYVPPGVTVSELTSPSIAPLLASPGSLCLVGVASGAITRTDSVVLSGTAAVTLPGVPSTATLATGAIVSVIDAINPSIAPAGYVATTDYTFSNTAHTITRVGAGSIPDGNTVYVTYQYTPADYFQPTRLSSMADIQNRFGPAWDSTGTVVNSQLSFAASIAFQNGANSVVLQPLYNLASNVRTQPNSTQIAAPATWATTLNGLQSIEDINIIVPIVGQSLTSVTDSIQLQMEEAIQDFVFQMLNANDQYVLGIVGEDSSSSSSVAQESTLTSHVQTLAPRYGGVVTEQMVFVNTSQNSIANSTGTLLVGSQYMAAAIGGMLSSRSPSSTLTRQAVAGFTAVTDQRTKAQMNADAGNGMLVVQSVGNVVQVRHGITMDNTTVATRELNVVRAKHFTIESVVQTLDNQVVGQIAADADAPTLVNNVVIAVLEDLRGQNIISDYANVQSRITSLDPTAMEVQFSYQPRFLINYINVAFSLDLTSNTILVTSNGTAS